MFLGIFRLHYAVYPVKIFPCVLLACFLSFKLKILTSCTCLTFTGHKTIVNTAVFHPHFLHVVTAGVEKTIHLHSPTPSSPCTQDLPLSSLEVRQLNESDNQEDRLVYLNALAGNRTLDDDDDDDDAGERQTIAFFDQSVLQSIFLTPLDDCG